MSIILTERKEMLMSNEDSETVEIRKFPDVLRS